MRHDLALTIALGLSVILGGCRGGAPPGPARSLTITVIGKSQKNPVFASALVGARAAAKKASERSGRLSVRVVARTPETENPRAQAKLLREALSVARSSPRDHAVLISCSNAAVVTPAIDAAVAAGLTVMTFDSDAPTSKRFAFLGANDRSLGAQIIDGLAPLVEERGKVAVLAGNRNAQNLQRRVEGLREAAKRYPEIALVDIVHHEETPDAALAAMRQLELRHPDLAGWAMVGGWPLFDAKLAARGRPRKTKIVAVDALPAQLPYVENGLAPLLLGLPTYRWGYTSVEVLVAKLLGDPQKTSADRLKKLETQIEAIKVTRDNLGGWARQLRAWGYDNVPRRYLRM